MENRYDFIYMATNDRLAQMLDEYNTWRKDGEKRGEKPKLSKEEVAVLLEVIADRLRETRHEKFNSEAFDV